MYDKWVLVLLTPDVYESSGQEKTKGEVRQISYSISRESGETAKR